MTTSELLRVLIGCSGDELVVLSSDPEGNSHSECDQVEVDYRYHDGELYLRELTTEAKKQGYGEDDVSERGKNCVVLWPA